MNLQTFASVDALFDWFAVAGTAQGEFVGLSHIDHGLQTAYELRLSSPDDVELQIAGLFHDLGHLLAPSDDAGHGRNGADAVEALFGSRVAKMVAWHVPAKRYLVAREGYDNQLSPLSRLTLMRQGGPMSSAEAAKFLASEHASSAIALRLADDHAKQPGRVVPTLADWRHIVDSRHLTTRR